MNDETLALLNEANFAQFGTVNADHSPHIDTVWFDYLEDSIVIATTALTKKARNIKANPAAYLVVTQRDNPYEQAQLKLRLQRIESDDELEVCDSIAMRYTGRPFPQRRHKQRIAIYLEVISCKYHIARV